MKLTPEQIKWVNDETATINRVLASKPENWLYWQERRNILQMFIQLHTIAVGIKEKDVPD